MSSGYLHQAQDSRDISEYAYKRAAASLLDYLDAERSYRSTQLAYRQALASYMTAMEQLKEALGTRHSSMNGRLYRWQFLLPLAVVAAFTGARNSPAGCHRTAVSTSSAKKSDESTEQELFKRR